MKKGFTLIELVIVIVILGILAAVAVPKFADLQKEARVSTVKGLYGAVNAAKDIVRAKWLAQDNSSSSSVNIDGKNITVNNKGYPTADANGIGTSVDFDVNKFDNGTISGGGYYFQSKNTNGTVDGTGTDGCGVYYKINTDNTTTVGYETDGC
jgi:MSHA pilin protein MshA